MKKSDVVAHYGTAQKAAHALQVSSATFCRWPDDLHYAQIGRLFIYNFALLRRLKKLDEVLDWDEVQLMENARAKKSRPG